MLHHPVLLVEARNDRILSLVLMVDDVLTVAEPDQLELCVVVDSVLYIMILAEQVLGLVLIIGFIDLIIIEQFVVHDDLVSLKIDQHGRAYFRMVEQAGLVKCLNFVVAHLVEHRGVLDLQKDEAETVLVGCQVKRVAQNFFLEF